MRITGSLSSDADALAQNLQRRIWLRLFHPDLPGKHPLFGDYASTDYNPYFCLRCESAGMRIPLQMTCAYPSNLWKTSTRFVTTGLVAFLGFILTGCETEGWMGAEAYSKKYPTSVETRTAPSPELLAAQRKLSMQYIALLQAAYPSYNGIHIESSLLPYELMASHPLFSGYEFAAGPLAQVVGEWIADNRAEFATAGIARVGIYPDSGQNKHWFNTAAPSQ